MSNESNQVFSAPGIYYKTPNETKNSADIVINASDIDTLEADVLSITNDIIAILNDISQLQLDVSQLQLDVTQLQLDVTQLQTDVLQISINTGNITTNTGNITTNTTNIGTNTTNIGTNTTNIGTNTTNISNNDIDILNLENSYVEEKLSGSWQSGNGSIVVDVLFTRYKNLITITLPGGTANNTGAASPSYDYSLAVSSTFRPTVDVNLNCLSQNNGTTEQGVCTLDTLGNLQIFRNINKTSNFGTGIQSGFNSFGVGYNVAT